MFFSRNRIWLGKVGLENKAKGYREEVLPRARGEAQQMLRAAEAYKTERVLRAQGDADRFTSLFSEYRKAPKVTRDRLYLEALERILPRVNKVVISDPTGQVMPLLSLPGAGGVSPAVLEDAIRQSRLSRGTSR